jgi:hypothetical protein
MVVPQAETLDIQSIYYVLSDSSHVSTRDRHYFDGEC